MNTFLKVTLFTAAFLAVALVYGACSLTRAGYKSPHHTVSQRFGALEIREYPDLVLAQTPSKFSTQGGDGSFMKLFRFITKGNSRKEAIPMTTPVLFRGSGEAEAMAFVLPEGVRRPEAPEPVDPSVHLEARAAGSFAVLRLKGGRMGFRETASLKVRELLKDSPWELVGEPEYAFYDPPWIPRFLEKNEIQWRVRLKRPGGTPLR